MLFPKVRKRFGRLASGDRLTKATVKLVGAALIAAGLSLGPAADTKASVSEPQLTGRVIVLPAAPAISITDGTTFAQHVSHSSHASHTSHGSHCSGYSYC
jgi:hypothetical protein